MNDSFCTVLGNRVIDAGVHMGHLRLHLCAVWQLAAIAIMVVMDLSSAYAKKYKPPKIPVCGKGCKLNKKGHLVCRIPKTWRVAFCPKTKLTPSLEPSPAPSDLDFLSPAPSPYDDLFGLVPGPYENFYDFVDFYEPTGTCMMKGNKGMSMKTAPLCQASRLQRLTLLTSSHQGAIVAGDMTFHA
jgi:hypothetical protein